MFLTRIVERKRAEAARLKKRVSKEDLLKKAGTLPPKRGFKKAISGRHKIHLIAEVKKASPSAGILREDFDPAKIAQIYETCGASAISVLTEKNFFLGHLSHISRVKRMVRLPVLRKDFIIDEHQIYESLAAGADAALLIAQLLSADELKGFLDISRENGMDCLVEVHSEEDLEKAIKAGADIVGINNRNFSNFKVDINVTTRLIKHIPRNTVKISESGIMTRENILYLHTLGVDAVLIGEAFMRAADIGAKVREMLGEV